MKEIKWAVLGCGVIANEMAVALQKNGKNIYAVGNRTHEKAAAFAEKYGIGKVYDDLSKKVVVSHKYKKKPCVYMVSGYQKTCNKAFYYSFYYVSCSFCV